MLILELQPALSAGLSVAACYAVTQPARASWTGSPVLA
jgi:hypothetical protein